MLCVGWQNPDAKWVARVDVQVQRHAKVPHCRDQRANSAINPRMELDTDRAVAAMLSLVPAHQILALVIHLAVPLDGLQELASGLGAKGRIADAGGPLVEVAVGRGVVHGEVDERAAAQALASRVVELAAGEVRLRHRLVAPVEAGPDDPVQETGRALHRVVDAGPRARLEQQHARCPRG